MGTVQIVLEYLRVVLSAPVMAATVAIVFCAAAGFTDTEFRCDDEAGSSSQRINRARRPLSFIGVVGVQGSVGTLG